MYLSKPLTDNLMLSRGRRSSDGMAKKRKSENAALDEVEKTLYTSFCTAANSISQLYTQAQNQQKVAFQAGERHAVTKLCGQARDLFRDMNGSPLHPTTRNRGRQKRRVFTRVSAGVQQFSRREIRLLQEKLYHWLLREHQNGSNITVAQIIYNLQSELEGGNGDEMTMSPGPQLQQVPGQQQSGVIGTVGTSGRTGAMSAPIDQSKISVFQSALSSPNRRCLPGFAMAPVGYALHNASVQPVRRGGLGVELAGNDLREDQLESAPREDSTTTGFGFHPPQHHQHQHQHQSQHVRDGAHTFHENDSSMDMHADGAADDYYR